MQRKTIRELRRGRGWTQQDLAQAIGVSVATVYKWEQGVVEPRAAKLREMADQFGVLMDEVDFPIVDTQQGRRQDES